MSTLADLSTGGRRKKIHDDQIVVKLPSAAKALVETEAERQDKSAAAVIRDALAEYFEKRGLGQ